MDMCKDCARCIEVFDDCRAIINYMNDIVENKNEKIIWCRYFKFKKCEVNK